MNTAMLRSFNQELYNLVKSGMSLPEGLARAAEVAIRPDISEKLGAVSDRINGGLALSAALAAENFPPYYSTLIKTGEISGDLKGILARLTEYYNARMRLIASLRQALSYPLMQAAAVIAIIPLVTRITSGVLLSFSDPIYLFETRRSLAMSLSLAVLQVGSFVGTWLLPLALLVSGWLFYKALNPGESMAGVLYSITSRLPYFNLLLQYDSACRLCWAMSNMLKSGIPPGEAVKTLALSEPSPNLSAAMIAAGELMESGQSSADSLRRCGLLPAHVASAIAFSEAQGNLIEAYHDTAVYLEEETRLMSRLVPSVWEVILIICAGLIIGALILAMLAPIQGLIGVTL